VLRNNAGKLDMHILFLGPVSIQRLLPFLPSMPDSQLRLLGKSSGTGLPPLIEAMIKRGHTVEVISLFSTLSEELNFEGNKFSLTCLPSRAHGRGRDLFKMEREGIREKVNQSAADIINAHWTYEYALGALDSRKGNVVVTARDCSGDVLRYSSLNYLPWYIASRLVYKRGFNFVAVSPHVYSYMKRWTHGAVVVIPNAIPDSVFDIGEARLNKPPNRSDSFRLMSSLSWEKLKNVKNALRAFYFFRTQYPNSEYHLYGPGLGKGGPAYTWAMKNSLNERVCFNGAVENSMVITGLKVADVYLHPSRTEACSMAVNEALACGVPVIGGHKSGGVPWQLQWGLGGMLVDIENPKAMAQALRQLAEAPELGEKLAKNAFRWAKEWLDGQKVAERYDFSFAKVLNCR
jgi:L-malate glycosyltransferase